MKKFLLIAISLITINLSITAQISRSITTNLSYVEIEKIGEYDKIQITNEFNTTEIVGEPELPLYVKSFVIPRDAQLVNSVNKQKVKGEFNVFPAKQF